MVATTVHSFILVSAAHVYLLRPDSGAVGEDTVTVSSGIQVLLQLRRNTGYTSGHWACSTSGHAGAAESILETALRETDEELGIGVEATNLSTPMAIYRTDDLGDVALEQRIDLFFTLRTWMGTLTAYGPTKNMGPCWFSLVNLSEAVPSHERHVLGLLVASLDGGKPVPPIVTFGFDEGQDIDYHDAALPY